VFPLEEVVAGAGDFWAVMSAGANRRREIIRGAMMRLSLSLYRS